MYKVINEDDIGELKAIKYKIKAILEHPRTQTHHILGVLLELDAIQKRFKFENKVIPESEEYLCLDDLKSIVSRFIDGLEDELEKKETDVY